MAIYGDGKRPSGTDKWGTGKQTNAQKNFLGSRGGGVNVVYSGALVASLSFLLSHINLFVCCDLFLFPLNLHMAFICLYLFKCVTMF